MSVNFYNQLPSLVIANGTSTSNAIPASGAGQDNYLITLFAPASLGGDAGLTYNIEVTDDPVASGSATWSVLQDITTTDMTAPLAGKAKVYTELAAVGAFRIKASGNVTADRTWRAGKAWTAD
jgi:hypothetical protein